MQGETRRNRNAIGSGVHTLLGKNTSLATQVWLASNDAPRTFTGIYPPAMILFRIYTDHVNERTNETKCGVGLVSCCVRCLCSCSIDRSIDRSQVVSVRVVMTEVEGEGEGKTPQCDGLALVRFKEREDAAKALKSIAEVKVRRGRVENPETASSARHPVYFAIF